MEGMSAGMIGKEVGMLGVFRSSGVGCTLGAFHETFQLCAEAIDTLVMKMLMCMGVTGDGDGD